MATKLHSLSSKRPLENPQKIEKCKYHLATRLVETFDNWLAVSDEEKRFLTTTMVQLGSVARAFFSDVL